MEKEFKVGDFVQISKFYVFPIYDGRFNYVDKYIIDMILPNSDMIKIANPMDDKLYIDKKYLHKIENKIKCNHEFIDIIGINGKSLGKSCKHCDTKEEDYIKPRDLKPSKLSDEDFFDLILSDDEDDIPF